MPNITKLNCVAKKPRYLFPASLYWCRPTDSTHLRRLEDGVERHEAAGVDGVLREAGLGVAQPRQPQAVSVRRLPRHGANLPRVVLDEPSGKVALTT